MKLRVRVGWQLVGVHRACARAHSYCSIVCKRGVSVLATVWCAGAGVRGTGAAASARAGGGVRNGSAVRGCVSSGACMLRQWCVRVCVPDRGMGSWVRTDGHESCSRADQCVRAYRGVRCMQGRAVGARGGGSADQWVGVQPIRPWIVCVQPGASSDPHAD